MIIYDTFIHNLSYVSYCFCVEDKQYDIDTSAEWFEPLKSE